MTTEGLEKLLASLGIQNLRVGNDNIHGCCPNHEEHRPSWGISTKHPHVHGCFACGFSGTLRSMLLWKYHYSVSRVSALLGVDEAALTIKGSWDLRDDVKAKEEPLDDTILFAYPLLGAARNYMRSRKIQKEICSLAELGYDRLKQRVVFPWRIKGKLYGLTGRAINPYEEVKTLPYDNFKKSKFLYIPDRLDEREDTILVEGEIDALAVLQAGFRSVAALGFGVLTEDQVALLRTLRVNSIVLLFDNDPTGHAITANAQRKLKNFAVKVAKNYNGCKDPGEMTAAQIQSAIKKAKLDASWLRF